MRNRRSIISFPAMRYAIARARECIDKQCTSLRGDGQPRKIKLDILPRRTLSLFLLAATRLALSISPSVEESKRDPAKNDSRRRTRTRRKRFRREAGQGISLAGSFALDDRPIFINFNRVAATFPLAHSRLFSPRRALFLSRRKNAVANSALFYPPRMAILSVALASRKNRPLRER